MDIMMDMLYRENGFRNLKFRNVGFSDTKVGLVIVVVVVVVVVVVGSSSSR